MEELTNTQIAIANLEKSVSLYQIAKLCGVSYITLRNIKLGKSKSVTSGIARKLIDFSKSYVPDPTAAKPRRGRKPRLVAGQAPEAAPLPAKAAPKKRGRKPGVKTAAKPAAAKRGRPKAQPAPAMAAAMPTAPMPAAPKKPGRPKRVITAAPAPGAAKRKPGRPKAATTGAATTRRGRTPHAVKPVAQKPAAPVGVEFQSMILGEDLIQQIRITEARLDYLRSLQKVEAEFIAKLSRKK